MFFYMSDSSPFRRNFLQKINISMKTTQKTNQERRKGIVSLRVKQSFSVILHNSVQTCKRISLHLFSGKKKKTASMTVEAAVVLPLFLFAVMNLISVMEIYRLQSNMNMKLHQTAKEMAMIEGAAGLADESDCIDLVYPYQAKPYVVAVGFSEFMMYSRMRTRAWTGYAVENVQPTEAEETVYVTEYGEVYHTTSRCSYLKLTIRAVDLRDVIGLKNEGEACYTACGNCGSDVTNTVFVTRYGTRYHATLQCSSLKRTVREIPLSQTGARVACKKCAGGSITGR